MVSSARGLNNIYHQIYHVGGRRIFITWRMCLSCHKQTLYLHQSELKDTNNNELQALLQYQKNDFQNHSLWYPLK